MSQSFSCRPVQHAHGIDCIIELLPQTSCLALTRASFFSPRSSKLLNPRQRQRFKLEPVSSSLPAAGSCSTCVGSAAGRGGLKRHASTTQVHSPSHPSPSRVPFGLTPYSTYPACNRLAVQVGLRTRCVGNLENDRRSCDRSIVTTFFPPTIGRWREPRNPDRMVHSLFFPGCSLPWKFPRTAKRAVFRERLAYSQRESYRTVLYSGSAVQNHGSPSNQALHPL